MHNRFISRRLFVSLATLLLAPCLASAAAREWTVTVSAGEFDRRDTPVRFDLEGGAPASGAWELRDDAGGVTRAQADGFKVTFILKDLKAGQKKTYRLALGDVKPAVPESDARAAKKQGVVKVRVGLEQKDSRIVPDMGVRVSFLGSRAPLAEF